MHPKQRRTKSSYVSSTWFKIELYPKCFFFSVSQVLSHVIGTNYSYNDWTSSQSPEAVVLYKYLLIAMEALSIITQSLSLKLHLLVQSFELHTLFYVSIHVHSVFKVSLSQVLTRKIGTYFPVIIKMNAKVTWRWPWNICLERSKRVIIELSLGRRADHGHDYEVY